MIIFHYRQTKGSDTLFLFLCDSNPTPVFFPSFLPFFDHISAVECHFDRFVFIFFFHQVFPPGLCCVRSPRKLYPYPSVSWSPSPFFFFSPNYSPSLPPSLLPPSSLRSSFAPTFSHTCSLSLDLLSWFSVEFRDFKKNYHHSTPKSFLSSRQLLSVTLPSPSVIAVVSHTETLFPSVFFVNPQTPSPSIKNYSASLQVKYFSLPPPQ
ncbi:hypothetical protein B9Z19DRAFT_562 [Tuber borchii]|uniref:Uncharacterized protein n=1 Tax=Tuber borchii TaxID=42251 RepID=A0A2T7A9A4_TUBBO|nr:hypothetical protein B9Z19DRAFT_562 [Tuber borchii]